MRLATVSVTVALAACAVAMPHAVSDGLAIGGSTASAASTNAPHPAAQTPPLSLPQASGPDPALIPLPIPETVPEMLAQLRTRIDQIRGLIDNSAFASIYVPAFQVKDLALALDAHLKDLPAGRRAGTSADIANLVRVSYMLDAFGDIGNRQQITEAFSRFAAAAKGIDAAFTTKP